MPDKPRRVEFHKDDWVRRYELERVKTAALENRIEQLKAALEHLNKQGWRDRCDGLYRENQLLGRRVVQLTQELERLSLRRKFRKAALWLADRMQTRSPA